MPQSGKVGEIVTFTINSPFILEGEYSLLWGTSSLFSEGTYKVLQKGEIEKTNIVTLTFNVPETPSGLYFVQFFMPNSNAINAQFIVRPGIYTTPTMAPPGSKVTVKGSGFPANDSGNILLDTSIFAASFSTGNLGSFTAQFTMPELDEGMHKVRALTQKLGNEAITADIEVISRYTQPTQPPPTSTPPSTPPNNGSFNPQSNINSQSIITLNKPVIISPKRDSFGIYGSQPVTFKWGAVSGDSVRYILQIATNRKFNAPLVVQKDNIETNQIIIEVPPGEYYWRVRATDSLGNTSEWSYAPYPFKVSDFPVIPVAIGIGLVILVILVFRLFRIISIRTNHYY